MPDLVPKSEAKGKPTLVIGLGNPLMGDDGVGLVVLDQLAAQSFAPPVEFVDGGTWGLALLPDVERAGALLLLDAVNGAGAPGTVYVLGAEEIPRFLAAKLSPHQVDVRELLALAELRGALPPELGVVGVQPAATAYGDGLSPAAAAAVEAAATAACAVLSGWGHSATARPAGA
ncbi:MAG: HyaD/HybD family hydrogenase maturation endopeptidase [Caldilineaceae bacterium]